MNKLLMLLNVVFFLVVIGVVVFLQVSQYRQREEQQISNVEAL